MDFPANTVMLREWLKLLYVKKKYEYALMYFSLSDGSCLVQIAKRRLDQYERAALSKEKVSNAKRGNLGKPQ